jgi:hypothetical protein
VFDNIGKDLDEEANKRRAASLFLTVTGLTAVLGLVVGIGAYTAAEVLSEVVLPDMVELLDPLADDALPPPPPPPPPPAAPEQEDIPEPDEMVDEIKELQEEVKEEIKADEAPADEGTEGGVEGGVIGGVVGGVVGGVLGGTLGGVRVFHHSELEVKKRINPEYPEAARALNIGDQRCLAKVFIDEEGVPYDVQVESCPKVFFEDTKSAILKWRWYPPKDGKTKVKAQTTIAVTYKLN